MSTRLDRVFTQNSYEIHELVQRLHDMAVNDSSVEQIRIQWSRPRTEYSFRPRERKWYVYSSGCRACVPPESCCDLYGQMLQLIENPFFVAVTVQFRHCIREPWHVTASQIYNVHD